MWRWARWVLLVAGVAAVFAIGRFVWVEHQKLVVLRERERVFAGELAEMRREFPMGIPRSEVVSGLHSRYPQFAVGDSGQGDVQVWLGREPSLVWYCNFMEPFLQFSFKGDGALMKIERMTTGQCL